MDSQKKVLLIGASGGIGHATVQRLLNEGYQITGTYNKAQNKITDLTTNNSFRELKLNIENTTEIREFQAGLATEKFYALVNCAGIVDFEGKDLEADIKLWDRTIVTNLSSNFYLARIFKTNLVENGRFIMISSTDAYYGGAITAAYAASKAGVNSLTKSLSLLFKDKQIRVNSIAPGWVSTPMIEGNSERFYQSLAETNPLKRIATPDDIAGVISFLLSEDSSYLNGQVLTVDGGYTNQDPTLLLEEGEK